MRKKKQSTLVDFNRLLLKERMRILATVSSIALVLGIVFLLSIFEHNYITLKHYAKGFLADSMISLSTNEFSTSSTTLELTPEYREDFVIFYETGENRDVVVQYEHGQSLKTFYDSIRFQKATSFKAINHHFVFVMDGQEMQKAILERSPDAKIIFEMKDIVFYGVIDETPKIRFYRINIWFYFTYIVIADIAIMPLIYLLSKFVVRPTIEAMKNQKNFVADASHELKTPLAIISAQTELLKAMNLEGREYLENIQTQIGVMNQTVLDMLELDRVELSNVPLEDINVSEILDKLCMNYEVQAFESGINFTYEIGKNLIVPKASENHINSLLTLTINNALKYTSGDKIVKVSLSQEKKDIVYRIYNTGCKVRDDERDKIFERFYRAAETNGDTTKGSGLGLSIVKTICEKYHYSISINTTLGVEFELEIRMR